MTAAVVFDNSYARLPGSFYARVLPSSASDPGLIKLNRPLATLLGFDPDTLETPEGIAVLAGRRIPLGADPIATAYAGHQFGQFTPQLGDGRAILLGEVVGRDGRRRDIQLKGSGRTPFSRGGDGRAALGTGAAGISRQRSHGGARHPDHARPRGRDDGRDGLARDRAAGRRPGPRGDEPHPRRHVSVLRGTRRHGRGAPPGRPRDRAALSRGARAAQPYRAFLEGVVARQAASSRAGCTSASSTA